MIVAGLVTLLQLYSVGPCGGKVPIIMGTSSGFIGVFAGIVATLGSGVVAYGAIMGASIIGGVFEAGTRREVRLTICKLEILWKITEF